VTFRFDAENHEYFLDDRRLESVTEILGDAGLTDYRFSQEWYMTRGKYIHAASEMIDRGTLDWTTLDPVLVPFCEAYQHFVEDCRPEIILSEKPMYHAGHLYAGTPDRAVTANGITALIDIKTGVPNRATAIQLSAYREMIRVSEDIHCAKCFSLHLRDDGNYRLDEIKSLKANYQIFLAALTVVRWKKEAA
jgi:hypothetical protein